MTAARITSCYDLMDSAYDCPEIEAHSRSLGHVPIIDENPRAGIQDICQNAKRFVLYFLVNIVKDFVFDICAGSRICVRCASLVRDDNQKLTALMVRCWLCVNFPKK
jgi:hypothetical protein